MEAPLLLDTDVLVDYLRGRTEAAAYLEARTEPLLISAITVAELFAGVRGAKSAAFWSNFSRPFWRGRALSRDIARAGGLYRRDYGRQPRCRAGGRR